LQLIGEKRRKLEAQSHHGMKKPRKRGNGLGDKKKVRIQYHQKIGTRSKTQNF